MKTLLSGMQNESATMAELINVLQQEQNALTQAPSLELMEEISALTQKKNQLISTIAELSQARNKESLRLGYKSQETTMTQWLQDQTHIACWEQLVERTAKAEELNCVNGLLISRHLALNQSKLDVLYKGQSSGSDTGLYDASGQSTTQRNNTRGGVVV